ncbi:hypothetical protein [Lactococcus lactis]|uniref:hypothetical protein n=1 Tax=Lactococcus lactis TaxID=1358 RepID=UPI0011BBF1AE|nr:hypothetical protein [Lactococcus lactis]QEA60354.1 hypothetical protein FGL73_02160 [Lactococcus lactis]
MSDLSLIFSKFSFLGNPTKLIKIFLQLENLIKKQKSNYPKPDVSDELYVKVEDDIYRLHKKKFIKEVILPNEANVIIISKLALANSLKIVGKPEDGNLNQILKALRKEMDLKKCQEIINEISDSFLTNLSIKELIKIIRKQMS